MPNGPGQLTGYGHAYQRLIDLGPEKLAIIEGRMAMAEPSALIGDLIQKEWGLCKEVHPHELRRQISRYRNKMVTPKMALLYAKAVEGDNAAEKHKQILYDQLNMLEELTDLYQLQKQRLEKGLLAEAGQKKLDKALGAEIEITRKIVADVVNLQFEMGMLRRAAKTKTGFVQNSDGSQSSFQITEEDGKEQRIRDQMHQFLEFVDAELIDAELPINPPAIGVDSPSHQQNPE